jgi:hypothetical protein
MPVKETKKDKSSIKKVSQTIDINEIENEPIIGKATKKDKDFRLCNKKLHLTYKSHFTFKDLYDFVNDISKIKEYSMVHEIGKTGYQHTHFLFETYEEINSKNVRIFDLTGIHPNITIISNKKHWENALTYHVKQGKPETNIGIKENKEIVQYCGAKCSELSIKKKTACAKCATEYWENKEKESEIMGYKDYHEKYNNVDEALSDRCRTSVKNANIIASVMRMKPVEYIPEPEIKWFGYQKILFELILFGKIDPRTIIWIKSTGGHGKTAFLKHLGTYYGDRVFVSTYCNPRDIATALIKAKEEGNKIEAVIINLARTATLSTDDYVGLEQLKDAFLASQKFVGKPILYNIPHIIVFSNQEPFLEALSNDKWDIREIVESETDIYLELEDGEIIKDYIFKYRDNPDRIKSIQRYEKIKKALTKQGFSIPGEKILPSIREYGIDSKPIANGGAGNEEDRDSVFSDLTF